MKKIIVIVSVLAAVGAAIFTGIQLQRKYKKGAADSYE